MNNEKNLEAQMSSRSAKPDLNAGFSNALKYLICVDEVADANMKGRLYCGCLPNGKEFCGADELIICVDDIMDRIAFPQSTVDKKSFAKKKGNNAQLSEKEITEVLEKMKNFNTDSNSGKKATFVLQVQFRQNASWQGVVKSVETDESYPFKSALELIKIIDEISSRGDVVENANGLITPDDILKASEGGGDN